MILVFKMITPGILSGNIIEQTVISNMALITGVIIYRKL